MKISLKLTCTGTNESVVSSSCAGFFTRYFAQSVVPTERNCAKKASERRKNWVERQETSLSERLHGRKLAEGWMGGPAEGP